EVQQNGVVAVPAVELSLEERSVRWTGAWRTEGAGRLPSSAGRDVGRAAEACVPGVDLARGGDRAFVRPGRRSRPGPTIRRCRPPHQVVQRYCARSSSRAMAAERSQARGIAGARASAVRAPRHASGLPPTARQRPVVLLHQLAVLLGYVVRPGEEQPLALLALE